MTLAEQKCEPCRAETPALSHEESLQMLKETPAWTLKDNAIVREFKFGDFREAIDFVKAVADVAEAEDHHPDMCIYYNKVHIELSTHKIGGLSQNDFILAAKIDKLV